MLFFLSTGYFTIVCACSETAMKKVYKMSNFIFIEITIFWLSGLCYSYLARLRRSRETWKRNSNLLSKTSTNQKLLWKKSTKRLTLSWSKQQNFNCQNCVNLPLLDWRETERLERKTRTCRAKSQPITEESRGAAQGWGRVGSPNGSTKRGTKICQTVFSLSTASSPCYINTIKMDFENVFMSSGLWLCKVGTRLD